MQFQYHSNECAAASQNADIVCKEVLAYLDRVVVGCRMVLCYLGARFSMYVCTPCGWLSLYVYL